MCLVSHERILIWLEKKKHKRKPKQKHNFFSSYLFFFFFFRAGAVLLFELPRYLTVQVAVMVQKKGCQEG